MGNALFMVAAADDSDLPDLFALWSTVSEAASYLFTADEMHAEIRRQFPDMPEGEILKGMRYAKLDGFAWIGHLQIYPGSIEDTKIPAWLEGGAPGGWHESTRAKRERHWRAQREARETRARLVTS